MRTPRLAALAIAMLVVSACGSGSDEGNSLSESGSSAATGSTAIGAVSGAPATATPAVTHAALSGSPDPAPVAVNLSSVGNVYALVNDGTPVPSGGIDNYGNAYSESLTGTSISWSGATFAVGASGSANGVSSVTVPLPAGNYSSVLLLATGVNGNQTNQTFVVNYTTGSPTTLTQGLSDWYTPQSYPGESKALTMSYRITASGAKQSAPFNLYGYTLAIDSSRTAQSITLPSNRNVVVVAIDLTTAAPTPPPTTVGVNLTSLGNVYALVNDGTPVPSGGIDNYGNAYSETSTGTAISWSGATFAVGASGSANGVSSVTVPLPAGNYSSVLLLATGVNGNQPSQTFLVNYTAGSPTTLTQGLSDWYTPQSYPRESKALTMSYRITASGAKQSASFNLYGYTFAIDSSRTVKSITLPSNRNVVVVAIDLSSAGAPVAATPTMSPPPGTYGTAQTVTLSDTTPGAAIYYTTDGTTPTTSSTKYMGPISVSATTTIEALAIASGYSNSAVATGTYTITGSQSAVNVDLSAVANAHALVSDGTPVSGGGIDGWGNAYSETLTGTSISWSGVTFTLGASGTLNAVRSTGAPVTLPAGSYASLRLLATAVNGNQPGQTFLVNYTDGTSKTITQSLSDWHSPQTYPGESIALAMPYRITASGAKQTAPFYLYGYSLAINPTKTVKNIVLPNNPNLVVLAMALTPVQRVTGVTFDWSSHIRMAQGSDNWPATWSDNDNQYAMWGDGGGFGGSGTDWRSSLGVALIKYDSDNYQGYNRYGGYGGNTAVTDCSPTTLDSNNQYVSHTIDGKSHGAPLSLDGVLYAWITPGSGTMGYDSFSLYKSLDKACSWMPVGVTFTRATYGISFAGFVQFGKDNGAAIDAYVYSVATAVPTTSDNSNTSSLNIVQIPGRVMLLRVPAASIDEQGSYQFYAGLDGNGQPTWSSDPSQAVAVYEDPKGVGPFPQMSYVPDLGRFVYTNQHGDGSDDLGSLSLLTMAEAPRPWGPWTDFYRDTFFPLLDQQNVFQWNFAPKWFRDGGHGFTLIFSGILNNDSWNTVDGTFTTSPP